MNSALQVTSDEFGVFYSCSACNRNHNAFSWNDETQRINKTKIERLPYAHKDCVFYCPNCKSPFKKKNIIVHKGSVK